MSNPLSGRLRLRESHRHDNPPIGGLPMALLYQYRPARRGRLARGLLHRRGGAELRRARDRWGARRVDLSCFALALVPPPSVSGISRVLVRWVPPRHIRGGVLLVCGCPRPCCWSGRFCRCDGPSFPSAGRRRQLLPLGGGRAHVLAGSSPSPRASVASGPQSSASGVWPPDASMWSTPSAVCRTARWTASTSPVEVDGDAPRRGGR